MSGPIFGSSSALGGSSGGNRHLVEFRAGRMNLVNKMVHPDNRKGLVYVYQAEDGLIHFCWKDRTTGNVEDDLIVFPEDCEFKKIENVKNGRVFLLKFKSSSRRLFFWMQEPKTDKDDEWCRRINEVINNPPTASSLSGGSGRGGSSSDNGDLQYIMQNMSQQQLMQLFGGVGQMGGLSSLLGSMSRTSSGNSSSRTSATTPSSRTSATTPSSRSTQSTSNASVTVTTPTGASNSPITPRAPRKMATDESRLSPTTAAAIAAIAAEAAAETASAESSPSSTASSTASATTPAASSTASAATPINSGAAREGSTGGNRVRLSDLQNYFEKNPASTTADASQKRNIDLSTAVNKASLSTVIADKDLVDSLIAHIPQIDEDTTKKEQLRETLCSPQFSQALSMFSNALQSGHLGPVVSQFKLNAEAVAAANSGDLEQFVKALESAQKKNEAEKAKSAPPSEEKTETKEENGTSAAKSDKKDDDPMTG